MIHNLIRSRCGAASRDQYFLLNMTQAMNNIKTGPHIELKPRPLVENQQFEMKLEAMKDDISRVKCHGFALWGGQLGN